MNELTYPSYYEKEFKDLRMFDDKFFKIVCEDKRVPEIIVDALLQEGNYEISEQQYMIIEGGRSLVYDIYVVSDKQNTNIEIENNPLSPIRVRYHASVLDIKSNKASTDFKDMKNIKVIFLCSFDPLGKGLAIYHIGDTIKDINIPYDDGREILLINGNAIHSGPLADIIHDLKQTEASNMRNPILKEVMQKHKENKGGIDNMSEIWDRIEARGEAKKSLNCIYAIMKKFNLSLQEALDTLEITDEEYRRYNDILQQTSF